MRRIRNSLQMSQNGLNDIVARVKHVGRRHSGKPRVEWWSQETYQDGTISNCKAFTSTNNCCCPGLNGQELLHSVLSRVHCVNSPWSQTTTTCMSCLFTHCSFFTSLSIMLSVCHPTHNYTSRVQFMNHNNARALTSGQKHCIWSRNRLVLILCFGSILILQVLY